MSEAANEKSAEIFECRLCGDCCRGYGGTYVTQADMEAIAAYIGADPQTFMADYCQMSANKPLLAQGADGYCVFFDKLCTIHPVKPAMCRRWPYLKSILVDVGNWHAMAGSCPGMRTDVSDTLVKTTVGRACSSRKSDE